jgi:hypothetical protein
MGFWIFPSEGFLMFAVLNGEGKMSTFENNVYLAITKYILYLPTHKPMHCHAAKFVSGNASFQVKTIFKGY